MRKKVILCLLILLTEEVVVLVRHLPFQELICVLSQLEQPIQSVIEYLRANIWGLLF